MLIKKVSLEPLHLCKTMDKVHLIKAAIIMECQVLAFLCRVNLETMHIPPIIPELCPELGLLLALIVAYPTLKIRLTIWCLKWKLRIINWKKYFKK